MVISVQLENGVALRNSMPCLEMITESAERDRRVCRASTVTCWDNVPVTSTFLALIQHRENSTTYRAVNWDFPTFRNRSVVAGVRGQYCAFFESVLTKKVRTDS